MTLCQIRLLTEKKLKQPVPEHAQIVHQTTPDIFRYLRPRRFWRQFVRPLYIGRGNGQIWHSTYYTLPGPGMGCK